MYTLQNWRLEVQQAGSSKEKRISYSCANLPNRYKVGECPDVTFAFSRDSDPINITDPVSNYGLGQMENMACFHFINIECLKSHVIFFRTRSAMGS